MTIATCDSQVDQSTHVIRLEGRCRSGGNRPGSSGSVPVHQVLALEVQVQLASICIHSIFEVQVQVYSLCMCYVVMKTHITTLC